jgi:hypothetical protein
MKRKFFWQRWSFAGPQLSINRRLTAPMRIAILLFVLSAIFTLMAGAFWFGRTTSGNRLLLPFTSYIAPVFFGLPTVEGNKTNTKQHAPAIWTGKIPPVVHSVSVESVRNEGSQIDIERLAQHQLAAQVQTLVEENGKLKEDLAFFETLLPSSKTGEGVSIRRLKADVAGANQVRYRMVVMQGGKMQKDFRGSVQFAVTVLQGGKSAVIVFPEKIKADTEDAEKFQLAFKRYQRVEGLLTLPNDTEMKSLQARIFEKGQLRAQQTTILEGNS